MVLQESSYSYFIDEVDTGFVKTQRHARIPPIKELSFGLKVRIKISAYGSLQLWKRENYSC